LGTLSPAAPFDDKSPNGAILVRVLAERGYTLGQNLKFDARGAVGQLSLRHQSEDGEGCSSQHAADAGGAGRRSDRLTSAAR
jgi:hypothetical protein